MVRLLLAAGAEVNSADDTPLMLAVWKGHVAVTRVLLEAGAELDTPQTYQPIEEAAAHGHAAILEMLVTAGVDINQTFGSGWTALMAASFWNRPEIMRTLLTYAADVDAISDDGYNALSVAARRNHVEILEILLAAGANVDLKTTRGWTALLWAKQGDRREAIAVLILAGADVTARVADTALDEGTSADLLEAARNGDDAGIRSWLAQGTDVNLTDSRGRTALMRAAANTHISAMEELLGVGAEVDARDHGNRDALFWAAANGFEAHRAIELLLARGATVHARSEDGNFPLQMLKRFSQSASAPSRAEGQRAPIALAAFRTDARIKVYSLNATPLGSR